MRLILSLLALASLAAPASAQRPLYRFHDIYIRGFVSVLDIGNGPQIIVAGIGPSDNFAGYHNGSTQVIVDFDFGTPWVYDPYACRIGDMYGIYNTSGWMESAYTLTENRFGPLAPGQIPPSMGMRSRGDFVGFSLAVATRWPEFGVTYGEPSCPSSGHGCSDCGFSPSYPDLWAIPITLTMR